MEVEAESKSPSLWRFKVVSREYESVSRGGPFLAVPPSCTERPSQRPFPSGMM